jgi:hypothetical protein
MQFDNDRQSLAAIAAFQARQNRRKSMTMKFSLSPFQLAQFEAIARLYKMSVAEKIEMTLQREACFFRECTPGASVGQYAQESIVLELDEFIFDLGLNEQQGKLNSKLLAKFQVCLEKALCDVKQLREYHDAHKPNLHLV